MKRRIRDFIAGGLVAATVIGMLGTAMAYQQQATLDYSGIKITLNGSSVTPKDANGKVVEPFAINGTTYLPVRAVGEALGLDVNWDGATSTVVLTSKDSSTNNVYITKTGEKYHYDNSCNGGTYWPVPLSTAQGMGLEPCSKCVLDDTHGFTDSGDSTQAYAVINDNIPFFLNKN